MPTTRTIDGENDKSTKNTERFQIKDGPISGSLYLPKGTKKITVVITWE